MNSDTRKQDDGLNEIQKEAARKFQELEGKIKKEVIQKGDKIQFIFDSVGTKEIKGLFQNTINRPGVRGVNLMDGSFYSSDGIDLDSFKKVS